jgi:hypothetical protein
VTASFCCNARRRWDTLRTVGRRPGSLAAIALASGVLAAGCGVSRTVIYPLNGAHQSYVNACKAQVAKEAGLSAALRSALEANCAHPDPAAVEKAATQSATPECQAALSGSTPGLPAAAKRQLEGTCGQASNSASSDGATAQACQQAVKSTVPPSLQQRALAACPKP